MFFLWLLGKKNKKPRALMGLNREKYKQRPKPDSSPLLLPSFRVHLIEPDFLLTACRFPSRVDTKSRLSGSDTVLPLQSPYKEHKHKQLLIQQVMHG